MPEYKDVLTEESAAYKRMVDLVMDKIGYKKEQFQPFLDAVEAYAKAYAKHKLLDELVWYKPVNDGHIPHILKSSN